MSTLSTTNLKNPSSASNNIVLDSSGRVLVGTSSTSSNTTILAQGNSGGGAAGVIRITSTASSPANGDDLGVVAFGDSAHGTNATIFASRDGGTWSASSKPSRLVFSTTADGAASPTERMRIDSSGNLLFNTTSIIDASNFSAVIKTLTNFATIKAPDTNTYMAFQFQNNSGTRVGYIQFTTTATTFSTSSDYRLKENIVVVNDGITRLQQLKPRRFNFIVDPDHTVDGFLAHEVQDIVPEAIQGIKDAVDADGNPVYQGIDQSKLVPLLTAALQEAIAKIEALETRLSALEGA